MTAAEQIIEREVFHLPFIIYHALFNVE